MTRTWASPSGHPVHVAEARARPSNDRPDRRPINADFTALGNCATAVALACQTDAKWLERRDAMLAQWTIRLGLLTLGVGVTGMPVSAQTVAATGLPSGFTAPGLPFGPTSTVATVAAPTATMALANPGGLSFGGSSGISGLGATAPGAVTNAGGLSFGGGAATSVGSSGSGLGGGAVGSPARRSLDAATGSVGSSGGGGAPAGAGIGGGFSRRPTDAYFDPLSGSGLR